MDFRLLQVLYEVWVAWVANGYAFAVRSFAALQIWLWCSICQTRCTLTEIEYTFSSITLALGYFVMILGPIVSFQLWIILQY